VFKKSLILLIVLCLSSCASTQLEEYGGSNAGNLVLTSIVGNGSKRGATYHISIREVSNPEAFKVFSYSSGNWFHGEKPDFTNNQGLGFVHITSMKPGHYEIYNFSAVNNNWAFDSGDFVIAQFSIEAGKSTYAGAYTFKPTREENMFGSMAFSGFELVQSMNVDRDIKIAARKSDKIAPLNTNKQINQDK